MSDQGQGKRQADETSSLVTSLASGQLRRRDFIRRAAALGISASGIAAALAACGGATATATTTQSTTSTAASTSAAGGVATTSAASSTSKASSTSAASSAATTASASSTSAASAGSTSTSAGPTKRGGGGTLKLLQWQAMTILNPHLSSGTKDDLACAPVYEGLLTFDIDGKPVAVLAAEIPSPGNGQLAADGKSVTFKLKQGVKWSDGQPFTADDVVFTWEYATDKQTAAVSVGSYDTVDKAEKVDDNTVKYTFKEPNPAWFRPGQVSVLPKHVFQNDKGAPARNSPNNLKPIGTGPYKVTDFKPGDTVSYVINENYREANKPFFDAVTLKGGGDAPSAARAVLQTGDYDYAWNLQIDDTTLKQLETGGNGVAEFGPGGGIERLIYNFADPNKEVDGERAHPGTPHPFFSDAKVRHAFTLGCNRDSIVSALYGRGGAVTPNILNDPPQFRSANNKVEFNLDTAGALLDEAGWKKSGQYREKGGVQLAVLYQTSTNTVRQKTQQIIKDGWEKVGIKTELKSIDSSVFFASDAGNPDTNSHFYADVEMFTGTPVIDPQTDMTRWHSQYIASKENNWSGRNYQRYSNPDYDKAWDQAKSELDAPKRAQLFIQMNDILIQGDVVVPLVDRKSVFGRAKTLKNINYTPWDTDYWNIANWVKS
jgi:peptide/nickel transport system substrate-binding protein